MADQHKTGWWQTIPGFLTAGAAFIAALSGLLAGLTQIGVFDRPAPSLPALDTTASVERSDTGRIIVVAPEDTAPAQPRPVARPRPQPSRPAPVPPPADTAAAPTPDTSAGAADTAPTRPDTSAIPADTSAPAPAPVEPAPTTRSSVLRSGTVLELAASNRVCSTTTGEGDRFTAAVVVPVTDERGVALPVGSMAVLEVLHQPAPAFIGARLDSIVREGKAVAVRKSEARVRREFVAGAGEEGVGVGACIPAGGRITATLGAPVQLGGPRSSR